MIPESRIYPPIPTREIPPPVVEVDQATEGAGVPRVLLQCVGTARGTRRVLLLIALFALVSLLEFALLLKIPQPEPLVVYADAPRVTLTQAVR